MTFLTVFLMANLMLVSRSDDISAIVGTAIGLGYRYFVGCTVIVHPSPQTRPAKSVVKLSKMLATPWGQRGCVLTRNIENVRGYLDGLNKQTKCSRALIVVYGDQERLHRSFTKLTHDVYGMKGPLWLIFLSNSTNVTEYLAGVNAPFDVDMIVAQYQENGTMELKEVYRASLDHPVRVVRYGTWSEQKGLISPPHVSLYYRRNNFEAIQFKVATVDTHAMNSLRRHENGTLDIVGYFATVWKDLEKRLNFTSSYLAADNNVTGVLREGAWSGVMGMVARQEASVGIALTISPERSFAVDFLRPLFTTRNQMYFKRPGIQIRMDSIFRPFQFWTWVAVLGWVILGSLFLTIVSKVSVFFSIESDRRNYSLINSFFCLLRSFSQQGSPDVPWSLSGRIIFITAYLVGVVMFAAYSGALISFIAVQTPKQPFKNLADLLRDGSYKVSVVKDTSTYMYFANGTHPTLMNVYNRLMLKPNDLPKSTKIGLEKVCGQSKLVFFGPQSTAETIMEEFNNQNGCDIVSLKQPLNTVYYSIAIYKNNQYKDALNHHLDMMGYQGLLGRLRRAAWPLYHRPPLAQTIGMKVEQVIQIYVILLGGLLLALTLFAFERWKAQKRVRKLSSQFLERFNNV